nr:wd repeat domain-containing protein 83 [Quercus suber]
MSSPEQPFPTIAQTRLKPPVTNNSNPNAGLSAVHALKFSSGTGQYLLTGSSDRHIRLYNPSTSRLLQTYAAHGYEILDLAVAADNASFASCGGDKTVFIWDTATAKTTRRFTGHAGRVNGVAFGGDAESVLVSGSFDGRVCVWDLRARGEKAMCSFNDAKDAVSCVEVAGAEIYAGSVDGRVRVYDLREGMVEADVLPASVTSVSPARVSGQGESYVVSTLDSRVRLMDRGSGKCLQTFEGEGFKNEEFRLRSCLAQADACVISGSEDGEVMVWDVLSGRMRHRLRHGVANGGGQSSKKNVVSAVAWNQMTKTLASAGGDGEVVIWGLEKD